MNKAIHVAGSAAPADRERGAKVLGLRFPFSCFLPCYVCLGSPARGGCIGDFPFRAGQAVCDDCCRNLMGTVRCNIVPEDIPDPGLVTGYVMQLRATNASAPCVMLMSEVPA